MFNPRQLFAHALILRAIDQSVGFSQSTKDVVVGAFLHYLQPQNMFCFWDIQQDCVAPILSNPNFHPKSNVVENNLFLRLGRGNWRSSVDTVLEALEWKKVPWELVGREQLVRSSAETPLLDIKPYIPKYDAIPSASEGWTVSKRWRQKPTGRE